MEQEWSEATDQANIRAKPDTTLPSGEKSAGGERAAARLRGARMALN
ncbi:hypothetical protein [Halotalea alkalilenta]|nr:hypothetical protein [Halotalea alkalilenta]